MDTGDNNGDITDKLALHIIIALELLELFTAAIEPISLVVASGRPFCSRSPGMLAVRQPQRSVEMGASTGHCCQRRPSELLIGTSFGCRSPPPSAASGRLGQLALGHLASGLARIWNGGQLRCAVLGAPR